MKLHHRVEGDGERVLVLSGSLGTTLELWAPQVRQLSTDFRIIRYDHPGHGRSPLPARGTSIDDLADSVLRLLDDLGIGRFSFCGLSLGGLVGMTVAASAEGRLDRLALCCTAPTIASPEHWANRAATVRSARLEAIADAVVAGWFTPPYTAAHPATVERFRAMLVSTSAEGYARCCEALATADLGERLGAIDVPTLVMAGEDDPVVSPAVAAGLARDIGDARLVVLARAAHLPNVERHEVFTRELLAHLTAEVVA